MVFKTLDSLKLRRGLALAAVLAGTALSGCHPDMWDQPRYKAFSKNEAYADGLAMRAPVEGTFAYDGQRREWLHPLYEKLTGQTVVPSKADAAFYTGKRDGAEMATNYFEKITPELLQRGKERFEVACSACHGYTGEGGGIIVQRGFPPAATFHLDRLREANDGYYYDVITNGALAACTATPRAWPPRIAGPLSPTSAHCSIARMWIFPFKIPPTARWCSPVSNSN